MRIQLGGSERGSERRPAILEKSIKLRNQLEDRSEDPDGHGGGGEIQSKFKIKWEDPTTGARSAPGKMQLFGLNPYKTLCFPHIRLLPGSLFQLKCCPDRKVLFY